MTNNCSGLSCDGLISNADACSYCSEEHDIEAYVHVICRRCSADICCVCSSRYQAVDQNSAGYYCVVCFVLMTLFVAPSTEHHCILQRCCIIEWPNWLAQLDPPATDRELVTWNDWLMQLRLKYEWLMERLARASSSDETDSDDTH